MATDTKALAVNGQAVGALLEKVLIGGDLKDLTPAQRVDYYRHVCQTLGLNPLTKPFEYLVLNDKLVLYAKRDATDQLRRIHQIAVTIVSRERADDVYIVTARATTPDGRSDEAIGAVSLVKEDGKWETNEHGKRYFKPNGQYLPLRGDALANAIMKCETKAKRRVTLSIIGLGWLDESEIETVSDARQVAVDHETGEIVEQATPPPATSAYDPILCEECEGVVTAIRHNGKTITANEVARQRKARYRKVLCNDCAERAAKGGLVPDAEAEANGEIPT